MNISLGTVQFGMDYGIANQSGRPSLEEVSKILEIAHNHGVKDLDTASSYGESEKVLGQLNAGEKFKITSKLHKVYQSDITDEHIDQMKRHFDESLQNLRLDRIETLLVHDDELFNRSGSEKVIKLLNDYKDQELIKDFGISVYEFEDGAKIKDAGGEVIQFPVNLFDQRYLQNNSLRGLRKTGRSLFLQGLFFLENSSIEQKFTDRHRTILEKLDKLDTAFNDRLDACLTFLKSIEIDSMILGFDNYEQITSFFKQMEFVNKMNNLGNYRIDEREIILPKLWSNL